jgi:serine protease Do
MPYKVLVIFSNLRQSISIEMSDSAMKSTFTSTRQPGWTAGAAKLTIALGLPLLCTSLAIAEHAPVGLTAFLLGGHGARGAAAAPASAPPGFLGIGFRDVTEDRLTLLKLKETRGAEVIQVDHDGPAGIAGLTEHDVILQVNGQAIEGEEQLRRILRETPVGRNVTLVFSRYGQQQSLTMQTADRAALERQAWDQHQSVPDPSRSSGLRGGNSFLGGSPISNAPITAPPDPHGHSLIPSMLLNSSYTGVVLEMIGPQLAQYFGSQGGNGLLVRSVDPNSPAAAAGLRAGDVVVRANAVIVTGTSEWYKLVRGNRGKPVAVVIMRDRQEETLVLVPDSKKRSSLENPGLWQPGSGDEQAHAGTPGGLSEIN